MLAHVSGERPSRGTVPRAARGRARCFGLCVALDDEDHRVAGDGAEADGPHVAELLVEAFTALTLVIWWAWSARV